MQLDQLKRRDFITLLGGAAVAWPLTARAQGRRVRRIGDLEWMIKVATVLCAVMVLVFSSENSAAQQSGIPAERYYPPPERYAREHCRPEPYTSDSLVGSGPTREEYMGFPPWAAWKKIPSIAVVSTEDDPRLRSVREADVIVALSDARLNSFTFGWPVVQKVVVGIQSNQTYPLTLPNGARNVIAHELGHVIGLSHNDDAGSLMCGRAGCHWPFPSEAFFALTAIEKAKLLEMYPPGWQQQPPRRLGSSLAP